MGFATGLCLSVCWSRPWASQIRSIDADLDIDLSGTRNCIWGFRSPIGRGTYEEDKCSTIVQSQVSEAKGFIVGELWAVVLPLPLLSPPVPYYLLPSYPIPTSHLPSIRSRPSKIQLVSPIDNRANFKSRICRTFSVFVSLNYWRLFSQCWCYRLSPSPVWGLCSQKMYEILHSDP